jgi:Fe2+ transport system protein B
MYKNKNFIPDNPTKAATLGWRAAYTVIAWIILGQGIKAGQGFFVALTLFSMPLLMDYMRFNPNTKVRLYVRNAGIIISLLWVIIGFIGLCGPLGIENINEQLSIAVSNDFIVGKGFFIPLHYLWSFLSLSLFLTIVDWIIYQGPQEEEALIDFKEFSKNKSQ